MSIKMKAAIAASAAGLLTLAACGGGAGADDSAGTTLDLTAFSIPEIANGKIQEQFAKTDAGADVDFQESYGPSGDQSRAVEAGLKADYVHLSLESDVQRLVDAGLVEENWSTGETHGIVANSVVVLVVREGNPKNIQGWDDLVKPGIGIVTPNPGSSGGARWNILAAYGQVIANGGSEEEAEAYLKQFFSNAVSLPGSARDATTAFTSGNGDVLVSYEVEAIQARAAGETFDYIIPDTTMLIETPAAVLKDADPKAEGWLDFVVSEPGQTEFARTGFRPVIEGVEVEVPGANDPSDPFPSPTTELSIVNDFGGWSEAGDKFFDEEAGLVPAIQKETGTE